MISLTVLGAGGLLGGAISRTAQQDSRFHLTTPPQIPWDDPDRAIELIFKHLESVVSRDPLDFWILVWAAGATVPASSQSEVDTEVDFFYRFANSLEKFVSDAASPGAFIYCSSAGAVYGSAPNPPFDELTEPVPNSPYGHLKRRCESRVESLSRSNLKSATLRISNLYGPGQRLDKAQGLISHLLKSVLMRQEINIFVPLETTRDYIYVDDCASVILNMCEYLSQIDAPGHTTKNVSSNQVISVASLIAMVRRITKRAPNVVVGSSPLRGRQALDMRISSQSTHEVDLIVPTPIEAGIHQLLIHMLRQLQSGGISN